ncbi:hypothetical protein [Nitratireductor pacificus]|uniref:hypothetical protein n=1 Tax=Nitratireductor pacificus TaxID=1231180 RepID=UPI0012F653DD|nr:hypothetical protein [Nitratireductor pacificus]
MSSKAPFRTLYCTALAGALTLSLAGCTSPWSRGRSAAPLPPVTHGPAVGLDCSAKGPLPPECISGTAVEADALQQR